MNMRIAAISTGLMAAIAFAGPAVRADDAPLPATLRAALAGAELDSREGWAFRKTLKVEAMTEPAITAVTRWDPSQPADRQCTVVSVTVAGGSGKASDEDPCKDGHDRELYGDLQELLRDATVEPLSEDDSEALYRIRPKDRQRGFHLSGVHVNLDDEDSRRLAGTVRVVKSGPGAPFVERVTLGLSEPAGNLLARLQRLDIVYTYAPDLATGAKLLRGLDVDVALRLLTFFDVTTDVSLRYDEYRRL